MGTATTAVLIFLGLAGSLAMGWWVKSVIEIVGLYLLLIMGISLFMLERSGHKYVWRAHLVFWALSLANITIVYLMTGAGGLFLLLLVIHVIAMLRALSRLEAQSAGIGFPLTYEGPNKALEEGLSVDYQKAESAGAESIVDVGNGHSVIIEDKPEIQVELETYKEGENAVPIIGSRTAKSAYTNEIDDLMRKVSASLKRAKSITPKRKRSSGKRGRPRRVGRPRKYR